MLSTSINPWVAKFRSIIGNTVGYSTRLDELQNWDKPSVTKTNDPKNEWYEHDAKVSALKTLINENFG